MQIRSIITKLVGIIFACCAVYGASYYPIKGFFPAIALLLYAITLWFRPYFWLLAVPAFLPILDFAPWTGWFFLEEIDLLLMVTAAIGYWRIGTETPKARLPPFVVFALCLMTSAYAISAYIGLVPRTPLDANAFSNYLSHYNSLRIAKGFIWALILLPLLLRSAGENFINIRRYFVPGMLVGLTCVALSDVWERAVFPGLMNFSDDYRTTAPFSAMHTGGAALDGYLALALPFVFAWFLNEKSWKKLIAAMTLFALISYASLTTFSRGVYLAYASEVIIFIAIVLIKSTKKESIKKLQIIVNAILLAIIAYTLVHVFAASGYRGFAASLILLGAAIVLGGVPSRWNHVLAAIAIALLLGFVSLKLSTYSIGSGIFKGPYLIFVISAGLFAVATYLIQRASPNGKNLGLFLAVIAIIWIAFNAVLLARHWGGDAAITSIVILAMLSFGLIAINRFSSQYLWHLNQTTLIFSFFIGIILALTIPTSGSYYMSERFSTTSGDFSYRMKHWQEALEMMNKDWKTSAFGMGLGRFPETYFWKNTHGEVPSTYRYEKEDKNTFLRLGAPKYEIGYGETVRMLQRVSISPDEHYVLSFDSRNNFKTAGVSIAICERLLLYPQNCVGAPMSPSPADNAWHHYDIPIYSGALGSHPWLLQAPIQMQISIDGRDAYLDIDNISLLNQQSGKDLIRNGNFSNNNDFWFFSSDRHHLPWHIKNFMLNIFFELGWFGLITFSCLIIYVISKLIKNSLHGEISDGIYLSSLTGFLLVGLFDSLLDVPRLTILFFLILIIATLQPTRLHHRRHANPS